MARRYNRDARGRFAPKGYSGQTSGRGARLMAKNSRKGGGARMKAKAAPGQYRKGKPTQRGMWDRGNPQARKSTSLTAESFTSRTRRAQRKLAQAQKEWTKRGRSASDRKYAARVATLSSAVQSLKSINRRARKQGLAPKDIFKASTKRQSTLDNYKADKAAKRRLSKYGKNRKAVEYAQEIGVSVAIAKKRFR